MEMKRRTVCLIVMMAILILMGQRAWAEEGKPSLTLEDVVRLSEKGEALRAEDFAEYEGEIYEMHMDSARYEIEGGYTLEINELDADETPFLMRLYYDAIDRCCIDIRYFDVEEFVNAENKSKYILYSRPMQIDDALALSELGDDLREAHFMHYAEDEGAYLEFAMDYGVTSFSKYNLQGGYQLMLGSSGYVGTPEYVWLMKKSDPEYCIDIREDDMVKFMEKTQEIPEKPRMTMEDVRRLSEMGNSLSWEKLTQYAGEYEVGFTVGAEYIIDDTYSLGVYGADWKSGLNSAELRLRDDISCGVDIRSGDMEAFLSAEDKSEYEMNSQRISREDVHRLSQKGDALRLYSFDHYMPDGMAYAGEMYTGEGDRAYQYVIDDVFSLFVGEEYGTEEPSFVRLMLNATPETYIDIRAEDAAAFFAKHDSEKMINTARITMGDMMTIWMAGKGFGPENYEGYGAKNIGIGFDVFRFEVEDRFDLIVRMGELEEIGKHRRAFLISWEDEDRWEDLWSEEIGEFIEANQ